MLSTSRLDLFLTPTGKTFVTQADLKELIAAYKELKKIKEQTPVAEFVTLFNTPKGTVEFLGRVPDRKLCDLKEGDLLYKQEVLPAQQSPASDSEALPFVPWSKEKDFFDSMQQSPAVAVPELGSLASKFEFTAESKVFEQYAVKSKMNMDQHPLHYIFLNGETSTARDAWRAAMNYAVKSLAECLPVAPSPRITEPEVAVPNEWKYVPIEPTQEMKAAGENAISYKTSAHMIWNEMLAAAPSCS